MDNRQDTINKKIKINNFEYPFRLFCLFSEIGFILFIFVLGIFNKFSKDFFNYSFKFLLFTISGFTTLYFIVIIFTNIFCKKYWFTSKRFEIKKKNRSLFLIDIDKIITFEYSNFSNLLVGEGSSAGGMTIFYRNDITEIVSITIYMSKFTSKRIGNMIIRVIKYR